MSRPSKFVLRVALALAALGAGAGILTVAGLDGASIRAEAAGKKKAPAKRATKKPAPKASKAAATPPPETTEASPETTPAPSGEATPFRGPTRIDFDDRLIQGQTNKSGAVYLFDRKETGIRSMVRRRKSFRHLTIGTIFDR